MFKTDSRVHLLVVLCLMALAAAWGCSQSDDITASVSLTNMWLTVDRLPTAPPGMVYELWVSENTLTGNSVPAEEIVSMGRFSYIANDTIVAFLDESGALRADSNKFTLDADILDYTTIFVSVELLVGESGGYVDAVFVSGSYVGGANNTPDAKLARDRALNFARAIAADSTGDDR